MRMHVHVWFEERSTGVSIIQFAQDICFTDCAAEWLQCFKTPPSKPELCCLNIDKVTLAGWQKLPKVTKVNFSNFDLMLQK